MNELIDFIMQGETILTVPVVIRLAIVYSIIDTIKCLCVAMVKGVK